MKGVLALSFLALATAAVVPETAPVISSVDNDELDPLTAATLEAFGGILDDDDDNNANVDGDMLAEQEDNSTDEDDSRPQVIHAKVTDDGMIEVEDMVLSPDMFDVLYPPVKNHPGNGVSQSIHRRAAAVSSTSKLWPGARIPYAYNTNLLGSQSKVRTAMMEWERYTCVRFTYRKSGESRYVQIRSRFDSKGKAENICSATLGYTARKQYVNLGKNCFSHRTILHELGHVLGLIHEHQHPSRDKYVTIVWNNIEPIKKHNFNPKSSVSSWGFGYDPASIMHYRSTSFRKSGCRGTCNTIVSKLGSTQTKTMGTATRLSANSDIPIVNKLYCSSRG